MPYLVANPKGGFAALRLFQHHSITEQFNTLNSSATMQESKLIFQIAIYKLCTDFCSSSLITSHLISHNMYNNLSFTYSLSLEYEMFLAPTSMEFLDVNSHGSSGINSTHICLT